MVLQCLPGSSDCRQTERMLLIALFKCNKIYKHIVVVGFNWWANQMLSLVTCCISNRLTMYVSFGISKRIIIWSTYSVVSHCWCWQMSLLFTHDKKVPKSFFQKSLRNKNYWKPRNIVNKPCCCIWTKLHIGKQKTKK